MSTSFLEVIGFAYVAYAAVLGTVVTAVAAVRGGAAAYRKLMEG